MWRRNAAKARDGLPAQINCSMDGQPFGFVLAKVDGKGDRARACGWRGKDADEARLDPAADRVRRAGPDLPAASLQEGAVIGDQLAAQCDQLQGQA